MLGFDNLYQRFLRTLRDRVRSGELTERRLALSVGVSQPHLHNILKGIRHLNAPTSDLLLQHLGMNATDLFDTDELRHALFQRLAGGITSAEVPVLRDRLGPGLPWPVEPSAFECVKVPVRFLGAASSPQVARLAGDPRMQPVLASGDLVLIAPASGPAHPEDLFAVEFAGGVHIRWLRPGRTHRYLLSAGDREEPHRWETLASWSGAAIRARIIPLRWMQQTEVLYDPLLPPR